MISKLTLKNFTAFRNLDFHFSPRVNVVVGSNSTGKTHLLKAIYGLHLVGKVAAKENVTDIEIKAVSSRFLHVFVTQKVPLGILSSTGNKTATSLELTADNGSIFEVSFSHNSRSLQTNFTHFSSDAIGEFIFIPSKEVMSLVRSMNQSANSDDTIETLFDVGHIDLANLLSRSNHGKCNVDATKNPRFLNIIQQLVGLMGGRYDWSKEGEIDFEPGRYEEMILSHSTDLKSSEKKLHDSLLDRFTPEDGFSLQGELTAEGYMKIGALHQLLCNGSIDPGRSGTLLWDEPETNLNPELIKTLVNAVYEISRNGQQVILVTHSYIVLKWFDLLFDRNKEDHVIYHSLYRDPETNQVKVNSVDSFSQTPNTGIFEASARIFDKEIERAFN